MNRRLFWKIYLTHNNWTDVKFGLHACPDSVNGWLYLGFTIFGYSFVYSDHWRGK